MFESPVFHTRPIRVLCGGKSENVNENVNNIAGPVSEQLRHSLVLTRGSMAMAQKSDRRELERRLDQARRMAAEPIDPTTKARLKKLLQDLEEQLREPE
jgi:hypothetical protein